MKPIRILLITTLAAIMCCSFTSCERSLTKCEITVVNKTQDRNTQEAHGTRAVSEEYLIGENIENISLYLTHWPSNGRQRCSLFPEQ